MRTYSKASLKLLEDHVKERHIIWKAQYAATPEINPSRGMLRAEIDILAGIYNHDCALFNKGTVKQTVPTDPAGFHP